MIKLLQKSKRPGVCKVTIKYEFDAEFIDEFISVITAKVKQLINFMEDGEEDGGINGRKTTG